MNDILNEKAGVLKFDNYEYRKEICQIAKIIVNKNVQFNDILIIDNKIIRNVKKYTFNINSLSWLKTLNIYYKFDQYDEFDAVSIFNNVKDKNLFNVDKNNNILIGTIFIQDNGQENITHVLFYEIFHLYDNSKFKNIWMEDEKYFFENNKKYDICSYHFNDNINRYSFDIHNIITESMKYANFTESHAFMENINFEMFKYLNNFQFKFAVYNKEMMFAKSSLILWDIYNLEKIIGNLRNINDDKKIKYFEKYKNEINKAFYEFNSYNKVINYIYKKLHKIILHSRILFDFYFELDSEAKKVYELDEKQKSKIFCHDHYSGPRRRLNE